MIGIMTVSHKRPRIDEVYCLMIQRLMSHYPSLFIPVSVVSIEEEKTVFEKYGIETYIFENSPLGAKHNHAIGKLKGKVTHVLHLGSDNVIDDNYMNELLSHLDVDIVWGKGLVYYSSSNHRARLWEECYKQSPGPGRLMRTEILDKVNWQPWTEGLENGMDGNCYENIKPFIQTIHTFLIKDFKSLLMDVKSEMNMHPYNLFENNGRELNTDYIYSKLSIQESKYLQTLN
jgi:hypothetical protein